jgi:hypothetical protein
MAFSVPLIDNSTLMLGRDNPAIRIALLDKSINLPALGFLPGEYPDFEELQQRLQDVIRRMN